MFLNACSVLCKFIKIPASIDGCRWEDLQENILESLTLECDQLLGAFKSCLTRRVREVKSTTRYKFGGEVVVISTQGYQSMFLPL